MKLKTGYLVSGILTGLVVLFTFIGTLPDGKLHITFCDVGQGDGAYIRFPDGRDMVVDGGPNDKIVDCLGESMPFWDREIDLVLLTHPQKDHMQGLIAIVDRYRVGHFVRSNVSNQTEGFAKLLDIVEAKHIPQIFMSMGETIEVGDTTLRFLWPSDNILGSTTVGDLNDYSLVFALRYGSFDALFTGDADTRVENHFIGLPLSVDSIEVLKVPHHGSKTGMSQDFVDWIKPTLSIISVGKNSYGHPTKESLDMLASIGSKILRTDESGNIEVVSDGKGWTVEE